MTTTAEPRATLTPTRITKRCSILTHRQREEGLTSNWFRALSLERGRPRTAECTHVLEAVSIAAFIGATNRIGIALAVPPNPEYTGLTGQ